MHGDKQKAASLKELVLESSFSVIMLARTGIKRRRFARPGPEPGAIVAQQSIWRLTSKQRVVEIKKLFLVAVPAVAAKMFVGMFGGILPLIAQAKQLKHKIIIKPKARKRNKSALIVT